MAKSVKVDVPPLPAGWKRMRAATKPMADKAKEVLWDKKWNKVTSEQRYGMGEVHKFGDRVIAFRWESHFDNHPSLRKGQREDAPDAPPPYWHPGISLWERVDPTAPIPPKLENMMPPDEAPFVLASATNATGTKGSDIASRLPATQGSARDQAVIDLVKRGNFVLRWTPVKVYHKGRKFTFFVTAEPLMLGEAWEDAFYPGVSAVAAQRIADHLNATLLTPKLVDLIWDQAKFRVDPIVSWASMQEAGLPKSVAMVDTAAMMTHSKLVKERIAAARRPAGKKAPLISNIGKYWVVDSQTSRRVKAASDKRLDAAVNYGWHRSAKGVNDRTATRQKNTDVYQVPGTKHIQTYSDYSQLVMLVSRSVRVCEPVAMSGLGAVGYNCKDGQNCSIKGVPGRTRCVDIYDLAQDPELASVLSHEGTVNMRLPSVPFEPSKECPVQALAAFNPAWVEYENDPDERDFPLTGFGESPYAAMGASALGDGLCGRPPPPARTVGAQPRAGSPAKGPLDKIAFGPWLLAAGIGVAGMIGFSLYLQAKDRRT